MAMTYTVLKYEPYENYDIVLSNAKEAQVTEYIASDKRLKYADDLTIIEGRELSEADVQTWFNTARDAAQEPANT
jgi:hypothetical protein